MPVPRFAVIDHGGLSFDGLHAARITKTNGAGGGAGQSVTVACVFGEAMPNASYAVFIDGGQDCVAYAASKTKAGFNAVLLPRLAANTLASGSFEAIIVC